MDQAVLSGVRVLDLSSYVAGPYCTKLLAEWGAEVIKIERPGAGDGARRVGPFYRDMPDPEASGLFLYLNTGKKSVTMDLKSESGRTILKGLVETADVLVESFSPEVMEDLGLGYPTLEKINPRLVMTSISNFGRSGPYRDYKATDIVTFAMSGLMSQVGDPDRPPLKLPGPWTRYTTGAHAFAGTTVALLHREIMGEGQQVEVSMFEVAASHTYTAYVQYTYLGAQPIRQGNTSAQAGGRSRLHPTKDGGQVTVALTPWGNLVELLGEPELLEDPRFATPEGRLEHGRELDSHVSAYTREHTKEELFQAAQAQRLTWAPINTVADLFSSPQLASRDFFKEIDHPATGPLRYPGSPARLGDTQIHHRRAPLLGEHNEEVYSGRLGYAKTDLVRLREAGVI